MLFMQYTRACLKKAFRELRVPVCGRFYPNEGGVAGYGNRMRVKYTAKWGLQIAEMIFQTRSSISTHVLLAEDNDLNAEIAVTLLEETGIVIERVEDGIQCVNRVEQMSPGTYDLILMDTQMPNMDGYQAAQRIPHLNDKTRAEIPIIAMTANAFAEDRKRAFDAGMNGHIAKPIDIEKLGAAILSVLKKQESLQTGKNNSMSK